MRTCIKHIYHAEKIKKNKPGAKKFEVNAVFNILNIVEDINNKTYKPLRSECFIVKEPKIREVFCANFRDRIDQHFVFNELNPVIEKILIFDAANCRKSKGTDFAINRVFKFIRRETKNYTLPAYFLKLDLSGFFMNIDRQILLNQVLDIIWHKYEGKYRKELDFLVKIIILNDVTKGAIRVTDIKEWDNLPTRKTLFNNSNGLPIGNICSQLFANLYLNDIDHIVKSRHKSYSRYVDDFIIVDKQEYKLKLTKKLIESKLSNINLQTNKNKTYIQNIKYGIPYLVIKIYPYYMILDKQRIKRIYAGIRSFTTAEQAYPRVASRQGMFERYHGYKIMRSWYNKFPPNITERLKISYGCRFILLK